MTLKYNDIVSDVDCDFVSKGLLPRMVKANESNQLEINTTPGSIAQKGKLFLASRKNQYISNLNDGGLDICSDDFCQPNKLLRLPIKLLINGVYNIIPNNDTRQYNFFRQNFNMDTISGTIGFDSIDDFLLQSYCGQSDGKLLILLVDVSSLNGILKRYNTDGSVDVPFGTKSLGSTFCFNGIRVKPNSSKDIVHHRYDPDTSQLFFDTWTKTGDFVSEIEMTASGGITGGVTNPLMSAVLADGKYVAEQGYSGSDGTLHLVLWNTDGSVVTQIDITQGNPTNFGGGSIIGHPDGGFVVLYWDNNAPAGHSGGTGLNLYKYDSSGTEIFNNNIGTPTGFDLDFNMNFDIAITKDNKIFIVGDLGSLSIAGDIREIFTQFNDDGTLDSSFGYIINEYIRELPVFAISVRQ